VTPPQAVYFGGEAAWVEDGWTDGTDWILEGTGKADALVTVVDALDPDCLVVDGEVVLEDGVLGEVEETRPVLALVPDERTAGRVLACGADEVYRCPGGVPDLDLLARRLRTTVEAADPNGVIGTDASASRWPSPSRPRSDAGAVGPGQERPTAAGETASEGNDGEKPPNHERRLERLIATTRRLMETETTAGVMEVTSEMAADVLGFAGTGVRRYRPETGTLESISLGATVEDIDGRPTYEVDGTPHGRAFREGRTVIDDIDDDDPYDREPFVQTMYVPIGRHGVLSVGRTDKPFDEADVRVAELLAMTTETALNRAERQKQLVHYREVLEAVAGMVFAIDESGEFTLVTEPFARAVDGADGSIVGDQVSTVIAPRGTDSPASFYESAMGGDAERTTVEGECVPLESDPFPVEVELSPLRGRESAFGGAVGLVRDVSELKAARKRLAEQRDRFSYLFDNLPDAVVEAEFRDGEPFVRSVNPTFEDVFGFDAEEVQGASLDEYVLPSSDVARGKRLNRRAQAGEEIERTVDRQTASGSRHFLLRVVPYEETGDGVRSFVIYTDITQQKQREESLKVINRVLRHNLRNELNLIAGYGDRIAGEADGAIAPIGAEIHDRAQDLAALGDKGREIQSAIRVGFEERNRLDLTELAADVADEFEERSSGAAIAVDLPGSLFVEAGTRLRSAIAELVENAVLHGGDSPAVRIEAREREGWAELAVADDGPGVPETERNVVTGQQDITQLEHASGLGLWLVKWIVEGYGGEVQFEDSELGGTTAVIRLPAAE